MDKVFILNIFLILIIVLIISLFMVYYFKFSRLATNIEKNLEYGCTSELNIPEPEYKDSFNDDQKELFYKQYILYGVNILYYYTEKDEKLIVNNDTTKLNKILYDAKDIMFGMFVYHKKAKVNFIIYRGSQTDSDWSDIDFDISQVNYPFYDNACVHSGFYKRFIDLKTQIVKIFQTYDKRPLYIGGHSLGSPICILTSLFIQEKYNDNIDNVYVYVFALPRMGNQKFAEHVNDKLSNKLLIYQNQADIIPQLPFTSTLNIDNKERPFIYYNFQNNFYRHFYCAQKYICSNHGLPVYLKNIENSKIIDLNYCNEQICKF